jgi:hypothetical protein
MHTLKKLASTIHILACLFAAKTFGEYESGGWNGEIDYCRYRWRGKSWIIPTSAVDREI